MPVLHRESVGPAAKAQSTGARRRRMHPCKASAQPFRVVKLRQTCKKSKKSKDLERISANGAPGTLRTALVMYGDEREYPPPRMPPCSPPRLTSKHVHTAACRADFSVAIACSHHGVYHGGCSGKHVHGARRKHRHSDHAFDCAPETCRRRTLRRCLQGSASLRSPRTPRLCAAVCEDT